MKPMTDFQKQLALALALGFILLWASTYAQAADLRIPKAPPVYDQGQTYDASPAVIKPVVKHKPVPYAPKYWKCLQQLHDYRLCKEAVH